MVFEIGFFVASNCEQQRAKNRGSGNEFFHGLQCFCGEKMKVLGVKLWFSGAKVFGAWASIFAFLRSKKYFFTEYKDS
jgi:hypothetical protein